MDADNVRYPRRRAAWASPAVVVLVSAIAVLLGYEILRANDPDTFSVKLLGVPTTTALLATTIIGVSVRRGTAVDTAPFLRYISRWVSAPERSLAAPAERFWQVRIRNAGRGAAVLDSVDWRVSIAKSDATALRSLIEVHDHLGSSDFLEARDYWIANYTPGMALAPDEERCYFECTDAVVAALATFEAVFAYTSLLGERFEKRVSLVPHPGASAVVLNVPGNGIGV